MSESLIRPDPLELYETMNESLYCSFSFLYNLISPLLSVSDPILCFSLLPPAGILPSVYLSVSGTDGKFRDLLKSVAHFLQALSHTYTHTHSCFSVESFSVFMFNLAFNHTGDKQVHSSHRESFPFLSITA